MNFKETYLHESFFDDIEDDIFTDNVDNTLKQIDNMTLSIKILSFNDTVKLRIDEKFIDFNISKHLWSLINLNNKVNKLLFQYNRDIRKIDLTGLDLSNITDMRWMFFECKYLQEINFGGFIPNDHINNFYYMFKGCNYLTKIICTLECKEWILSNVAYNELNMNLIKYLEFDIIN